MNAATTTPHSSWIRSFARVAFALVLAGAPVGCIIDQTSTPAPDYSPEDFAVTQPDTPTIDAHFDQVFNGVACTPNDNSGIATWLIEIDNTSSTSGQVSCDDPSGLPFIVAFNNLQGDTVYTLTATGYLADGTACYVADCSAHTMPGPYAVLPSCSVTRTC